MRRNTLCIGLLCLGFLYTAKFAVSQEIPSSGSGNVNVGRQVKPTLTAEQIAQKFLPGVALIICDDGKGNYSQGSGFFIASNLILTNAHVVRGMTRGAINLGKDQKKYRINAVGFFNDEDTDLALLVSDETKNLKVPIIPPANLSDLKIGETIYVLSNPEGLAGTISQGIVSSEMRRIKNKDLLQITAAISPGSSGGAVVNSRGETIGMATGSYVGGQNLNFAVPITRIKNFLKEFNDQGESINYVPASEIAGSWLAPKTFLNESEISNVNPPALNAELKPILEKTNSELVSRIMNLNHSFLGNRLTYENVSINQCLMKYSVVEYGQKGEAFKLTDTSVNLKFVDDIEIDLSELKPRKFDCFTQY